MKGVILAGGLGTRLYPLTRVTNKHLLPIYNRPMIYYPIETLVEAGVRDIMVVTGGNSAGQFLELLGNGNVFGLQHLNYTYQEGEGGIADALKLAEHFVNRDQFVLMLGDNFVEESIRPFVEEFEKQEQGARILLKEVEHPEHYGVAEIDGDKITQIVEKPKTDIGNLAVTGIYLYDEQVWDMLPTLKPSARGELEITDVNNAYLEKGELKFDVLSGWWADAGESFETYLRAQNLAAERDAKRNAAAQK